MQQEKGNWKIIFRIILGVVLILLFNYFVEKGKMPERIEIIKTDTLTITKTDTIRIKEPEYIYIRVVDTFLIPYLDSVFIPVPVEQKFYSGSDYKAYVSGYRPKLDSIMVYPKTINRYINTTEKVYQKPKKWGIGVSIGAGLDRNFEITPYIGIGIQYNLIRF